MRRPSARQVAEKCGYPHKSKIHDAACDGARTAFRNEPRVVPFKIDRLRGDFVVSAKPEWREAWLKAYDWVRANVNPIAVQGDLLETNLCAGPC